jgi:hypothetical protein
MESFMDWRLIYRNEHHMHALAAALPRNELASYRVFNDAFGAVTYLVIEKGR